MKTANTLNQNYANLTSNHWTYFKHKWETTANEKPVETDFVILI